MNFLGAGIAVAGMWVMLAVIVLKNLDGTGGLLPFIFGSVVTILLFCLVQ